MENICKNCVFWNLETMNKYIADRMPIPNERNDLGFCDHNINQHGKYTDLIMPEIKANGGMYAPDRQILVWRKEETKTPNIIIRFMNNIKNRICKRKGDWDRRDIYTRENFGCINFKEK